MIESIIEQLESDPFQENVFHKVVYTGVRDDTYNSVLAELKAYMVTPQERVKPKILEIAEERYLFFANTKDPIYRIIIKGVMI